MFSDFALGTVRRNARAGLSVGMGGQQQGGMYRSLRVAPNVQALNARRQLNAQAVGREGVPGVGTPPLPPQSLPQGQQPPGQPYQLPQLLGRPPLQAGYPENPLQMALRQIGASLLQRR